MQQDQASNIPSIFRDHRLFGTLRQDELSELFSSARTSQYRKGNSIFAKGAPGTTLMAILSGTVRINSTSVDGHDLIYALLSAGETFGEIALFSGGNRTADAIAESDCKLLAIDRSSFTAFLTRHPEVSLRLLDILACRLRDKDNQLEDILFSNLRSRLARLMLQEIATAQSLGGRGAALRRRISPTEVAARLGSARESVSRQLAAWRKNGMLRIDNGLITICDIEAFRKLTELPDP
jgi:CRP/FNR family transcriptional regulator, cyclic AMP receptor protein